MHGFGMEDLSIDEIALDNTQSLITLAKAPNKPGLAAHLFDQIALRDVFVDMIVQSHASDDVADITFTVDRKDFDRAFAEAQLVCDKFGCEGLVSKREIAKLSVFALACEVTLVWRSECLKRWVMQRLTWMRSAPAKCA